MPETIATYHPRVKHSLSYYHSVLLVLIEALNANLSDKQIADKLTAKGIKAPSGKLWTAASVKQALHKIRHWQVFPSRLHAAMLELCFAGLMQSSDALVLFQTRNRVM